MKHISSLIYIIFTVFFFLNSPKLVSAVYCAGGKSITYGSANCARTTFCEERNVYGEIVMMCLYECLPETQNTFWNSCSYNSLMNQCSRLMQYTDSNCAAGGWGGCEITSSYVNVTMYDGCYWASDAIPTPLPGTPAPQLPQSCPGGWYTNPDTCYANGCTYDGSICSGSDCCCVCNPPPDPPPICDSPPPVEDLKLNCDRGTGQMILEWRPQVTDSRCWSTPSLNTGGYTGNNGTRYFYQNFFNNIKSTAFTVNTASVYNNYSVAAADKDNSANDSWTDAYNPITNSGTGGDRTFNCSDSMGRVATSDGVGVGGVEINIFKCSNYCYPTEGTAQLVATLTTDSQGYYYVPYSMFSLPNRYRSKNYEYDGQVQCAEVDYWKPECVPYAVDWKNTRYAIDLVDKSGKYLTPSRNFGYAGQESGSPNPTNNNCAHPLALRTDSLAPYRGRCNFEFQNAAPTFTLLNTRKIDSPPLLGNNRIPSLGTFVSGAMVWPEDMSSFPSLGVGASTNHICQTEFNQSTSFPRTVSFRLRIDDTDGYTDITKMKFKLQNKDVAANYYQIGANINHTTKEITTQVENSLPGITNLSSITIGDTGPNYMTAVILLEFDQSMATNAIYNLYAYGEDKQGTNTGWVYSNRTFKVWDCNVSTSGTFYDASAYSSALITACDPSIYTTVYGGGSTLSILTFNSAISNLGNVNAVVNSPTYNGTTLIWGGLYNPTYNSEFDMPAPQILSKDVSAGVGSSWCVNNFSNSLDLGKTSPITNKYHVNPYQTTPRLEINFAGVRNQAAWYQAVNGGGLSNGDLINSIPLTCSSAGEAICKPAISINSVGTSASGIIAAQSITNQGGCNSSLCTNGHPAERNWSIENINTVRSVSYQQLLNQIFYQYRIGETKIDLTSSALAPIVNQVYFVSPQADGNGTYTVDDDYTLNEGALEYNIFIINGNMNIDETVERLDGIFIVSGTVTASGVGTTNLVINGSVFAKDGIRFNRDLGLDAGGASKNNLSPGVIVHYRPDFLFSIPQILLRSLSNWREGGGI